MKRKLKVSDLEECGACQRDMRKFKRMWPDGVYISKENVLLALKEGMDVPWLVTVAVWGHSWNEYLQAESDLAYSLALHEITHKQYNEKKAELVAKTLREHWEPR